MNKVVSIDVNALSAAAVNPSYKSGMLKPCWCCCNRKARVQTVSPNPGDTSFSRTAERDRLICPSQERSPCEMKDWGGREQTQIRTYFKTQTSRLIFNELSSQDPRWGFMITHLLYKDLELKTTASDGGLLTADTEAGSSPMVSGVTCTDAHSWWWQSGE